MNLRLGRATGAGMLSLALFAGCVGIPDDGTVTKVDVESGPDQSTVRYSPTGPARDANPQQIVRGYLDAMLAYPVTTGTAASFLTPEAAREWKSSAGVEVYVEPKVAAPVAKDPEGSVENRPAVEVDLDMVEDAQLNSQGRFARINTRKQFTYRLIQSDGQWRITNPQPGFLVNRKFFDDYYRAFDAFFFDRPGKRLVADPIYLPVGDQLSTALLGSLLLGPKGLLGKTARTFVPEGARLRTSVPSRDDGLADVQFREDLNELPSDVQERLSAQIIWTLKQVDQVTGVRIAGSDVVLIPGNRGNQSVDSWAKFGPRFGDGGFYGIQEGRVVEVSGGNVEEVDGPWGESAGGAVGIAIDSGRIASVRDGGKILTVGSLAKASVNTFSGSDLLRPVWDDTGKVWAVDSAGGATRLRIFSGKKFRAVPVGALADYRLNSFALSPDGARYAAVARVGNTTQVYVGSVLRNAQDVVIGLGTPENVRPKNATFASPRSVSWATPTTVTFLAEDNVAGTQIFEVRIDGSASIGGTAGRGALLPDVRPISLATTGGEDPIRYVTDSSGKTWILRPGRTWILLDAGGITSLTASTAVSTG